MTGWPIAVAAVGVAAICAPAVVGWARYEIALARRVSRRERIVDARQVTLPAARQPSAAAATALSPAAAETTDELAVRSMIHALDAVETALTAPPRNVVPLQPRKGGR